MEKKVQSEWWFLGNINFVTVGISYFVYLIILLLGNIIDVAVSPAVAAGVIAVIFAVSNFIASKLVFVEAKLEKNAMIKYLIWNFVLFLFVSYNFVPFIATYIGFEIVNSILVSVITAIVAFAVNTLFVINLND